MHRSIRSLNVGKVGGVAGERAFPLAERAPIADRRRSPSAIGVLARFMPWYVLSGVPREGMALCSSKNEPFQYIQPRFQHAYRSISALGLAFLCGCAAGVDPRHLEADRSDYYPLAVVAASEDPLIAGKTERAANQHGATFGCIITTIWSYGILAPLCAPAVVVDGVAAVKVANLEKEHADKVQSLKPRFNTVTEQATLRSHAVHYLRTHSADVHEIMEESLPSDPLARSRELRKRGYPMALELALLSLDFSERRLEGNDWSFCLVARIQASAIATSKNTLVASEEARGGTCKPLEDWLKDGELEETALNMYAQLSVAVVNDLLLLHRKPASDLSPLSPLAPLPVSTDDHYGRAHKPKIRQDFQACCFSKFTDISTKPRFEWSAFNETDVSDVRYDLQIRRGQISITVWVQRWSGYKPGAQVISPAGVVYSRQNLPRTWHELERPLEPCSWYFWAVRARYRLNGHPRVTEWSVEKFPPHGVPSMYPIRTIASNDDLDCWNDAVDWSIR